MEGSNQERIQQFTNIVDVATSSVDAATDAAIEHSRYFAEKVTSAVAEGLETAKVHLDVLTGAYKQVEDTAIGKMKEGVYAAIDNPQVSLPILGAAVLLPIVPRRLLYRATLGRFRNQQAVLNSAETRLKSMKMTASEYELEKNKLMERAIAAEQELLKGRRKLTDAITQLNSLAGQISSETLRSGAVIEELREIHGAAADFAVTLRMEAAKDLAAKKALESTVKKYADKLTTTYKL
eukprot:jgi/Mesvir1/20832/Mv07926-RA.1